MWKFIIILSVITISKLKATSLITQLFNGELSQLWYLKFTVIAKVFRGVILESFDKRGNHLQVEVNNLEMNQTFLTLKFNGRFKEEKLKDFCNCEICTNIPITIVITFQHDSIRSHCNKMININFYAKTYKIPYMPDTITISVAKTSRDIKKKRPTFIGCLVSLYFNQKQIEIDLNNNDCTNESALVKPGPVVTTKTAISTLSSITVTTSSTEHASIKVYNISCNCSNTICHGYRNSTSLHPHPHVFNQNNSYTPMATKESVTFTLSWLHDSSVKTCLMQFIMKFGNLILVADQYRLMMGSYYLGNLSHNSTNCVLVTITEGGIIINVNDKVIRFENGDIIVKVINVMFDEVNEQCSSFNGYYDLRYNQSQLKLVQYNYTRKPKIPVFLRQDTDNWKRMAIVSFFLLSGLLLVIISLAIILLANYYRNMIASFIGFDAGDNESEHIDDISYVYSSINQEIRNSVLPCQQGSDGSYMVPKRISVKERRPPLPQRDGYDVIQGFDSIRYNSSVYSSINHETRNSVLPCQQGSDGSYMAPKRISVMENRPPLPQREHHGVIESVQ